MASDEENSTNRQLLHAVQESLNVGGWGDPNLLTTDVLVLVAQQGFDGDDQISRVVPLQPTDGSNHSILGMIMDAKLQFEEETRMRIRAAWTADGDDD